MERHKLQKNIINKSKKTNNNNNSNNNKKWLIIKNVCNKILQNN